MVTPDVDLEPALCARQPFGPLLSSHVREYEHRRPWRITEMDNWDQEAVDLVQPGFIEFDEDGLVIQSRFHVELLYAPVE